MRLRILVASIFIFLSSFSAFADTTYTVQASDLWDNGYNNTSDDPRQSDMARFRFTVTSATSWDLTITATLITSGSTRMPYIVDGVVSYVTFTVASGQESFVKSVTSGTHTIEIATNGFSSCFSPKAANYIDSVTYPDGVSFSVLSPSYSNRVVVYGDSIGVGQAASPTYTTHGWAGLLRYTYSYSILAEAWGCRSLYSDTPSTLATKIASYNPSVVWLAIGTNDYGLSKQSSTNFGSDYKDLLDGLRAALPSVPIVCQTPIVRTTETEKVSGWGDLSAYRTQIQTQCATVTGTTFVDGTAILTTGDLSDGVHPTTAGHATYASYAKGILDQIISKRTLFRR